jgi:hypothetical protein
MIFQETLTRLQPEVDAALNEVFAMANSKQTHEQDMLLILINGFYAKWLDTPNSKFSPFMFGTGGWPFYAGLTQFKFYDLYIQDIISAARS